MALIDQSRVTQDHRDLAMRLGLGDLTYPPVCHGLACGCKCDRCLEQIEQLHNPPQEIRQPWEPKP